MLIQYNAINFYCAKILDKQSSELHQISRIRQCHVHLKIEVVHLWTIPQWCCRG